MNMITTIIEAFSFDFFQRAVIMGSLLAIVYALIGNFVVIRREAIIGHSISNMAFLGIALGTLWGFNLNITSILTAIVGAYLISYFQNSQKFSSDSILEFSSQLAIAGSIIIISLLSGYRTDLMQYLFGSIIAISKQDMIIASFLSIATIILIFIYKNRFLQIAFNRELAIAAKTPVKKINLIFIALLAINIALGIKIIGIILLSAFLVIPPNIAKIFAKNFQQMITYSVITALLGTVIGLICSYILDIPSGPSIIIILGLILVSSQIKNILK